MTFSVFHWRSKEDLGNFGDALTLLYFKRVLEKNCLFRSGVIHLIGSVISVDRISTSKRNGFDMNDGLGRAIFWGCGKKNADPLPADLLRRAIFLGIRGTLSRDALGLPRNTPMGDTALLLPQFYAPSLYEQTAGKILWVPHVHHPEVVESDLGGCTDPVVMSPAIPNTPEACEAFIDAIASARFVMANAMHAAVVALAYGVPFAFWGGRYINHPFKWSDFASGVGFELPFVSTFAEAQAVSNQVRPDRAFKAWNPVPIMEVAPYRFRVTA